MRALSLSLISLVLLAGTASAAERCVAPNAVAQLDASQVDDLVGSYRLSDGRKLRLSAESGRLYAEFKDHRAIYLEAVGPNKLSSKDGKVSITYVPGNPVETLKLGY